MTRIERWHEAFDAELERTGDWHAAARVADVDLTLPEHLATLRWSMRSDYARKLETKP